MSEAEKGYNARDLKIFLDEGEGPVLIAAVQSRDIARPREAVDVSNDDSDGWRRLLGKPGTRAIDVSIEGVATVDNYERFLVKWNGATLEDVTLAHPDGSTETGDFFLSNLQHQGSHEEHVAFTAELQSADAITRSAPAAPVNVTLPAVSGQLIEDQVLTAFPGIWTGAPEFTYQWNRDEGEGAAPIANATGKTYTLVTADVDATITVTVTATNPAGSTPATSAATAAIVAAE